MPSVARRDQPLLEGMEARAHPVGRADLGVGAFDVEVEAVVEVFS